MAFMCAGGLTGEPSCVSRSAIGAARQKQRKSLPMARYRVTLVSEPDAFR
jgi:hypothetical protein